MGEKMISITTPMHNETPVIRAKISAQKKSGRSADCAGWKAAKKQK